MGIYINPSDNDKEGWLRKNGFEASDALIAKNTADFKTHFPICLVDNGHFTAAAVADTEEEFERFNDPRDLRPKHWFVVGIDQLTSEVIGKVYANHLRNGVAEA